MLLLIFSEEDCVELEALYRRYCVRLKHSLFVAALDLALVGTFTCAIILFVIHQNVCIILSLLLI